MFKKLFATLLLLVTMAMPSFGQGANTNQYIYFHNMGHKPVVLGQKYEMLPDFITVAQMNKTTGTLTPLTTYPTGNFSEAFSGSLLNDQSIATYVTPNAFPTTCLFVVSGNRYPQNPPDSTYIESYMVDASSGALSQVGTLSVETTSNEHNGGQILSVGSDLIFAPFSNDGTYNPVRAFPISNTCALSVGGTDSSTTEPMGGAAALIGGYNTILIPDSTSGVNSLKLFWDIGSGTLEEMGSYSLPSTDVLGNAAWDNQIGAFIVGSRDVNNHLVMRVVRILQANFLVTTTTFSLATHGAPETTISKGNTPTILVSASGQLIQFLLNGSGVWQTLGISSLNASGVPDVGSMSMDSASKFLVVPEVSNLATDVDFSEYVFNGYTQIPGSPYDFGWVENGWGESQNSVAVPAAQWSVGQ